MCGSETTRGLSRKRSSLSASGMTKTSDCKIAVEQKAISLEVSEASIPTRDLNHWRSSSTREISAMGVLQTNDASRVRSSKDCSGSVSRMAYFSRAATRASSLAGLAMTMSHLLGKTRSGVHPGRGEIIPQIGRHGGSFRRRDVFAGVGELEDQELAVRVKGAAGGGLGFLERIVGEEVRDLGYKAGRRERFFDVVALEIDVRIDLVGDAVIALVAFESDVVRGGANPERFALDLEWSFPNAQMVARPDDANGLSVRPTVILRATKEVELAHGHGQIGFFRKTAENAVKHGVFHVGVDFHPAGGGENALHGGFGAEDEEVDHVAGIAVFVADAPRNLGEELVVNAGKRSDLPGGDASGAAFGSIDFDADGVVPVAGVAGGLIDADGEAARHRSEHVAARADQKRLSSVLVADTADERAAAGFVEG